MSHMQELLDYHLTKEEAKDGLAVIVFMTNGSAIPGAMRKTPVEGTYQLRTAGKKMIDGRPTNTIEVVDVYFTAESVHSFSIPVDSRIIEPPRIHLPANGA